MIKIKVVRVLYHRIILVLQLTHEVTHDHDSCDDRKRFFVLRLEELETYSTSNNTNGTDIMKKWPIYLYNVIQYKNMVSE